MEIEITRTHTALTFSLRNLRDLVAQVEARIAEAPDASELAQLERNGLFGLFYIRVESDLKHYGERIPGRGAYDERPFASPAEEDRLRQEHDAQHARVSMVELDFPCCAAGHSDGTETLVLSSGASS